MIFESKPVNQLPVAIVPMIDIAYIIITFFLVFSIFRGTDASLKLRLPKAETATQSAQSPIVITVDDNGRYLIPSGEASPAELQQFLRRQLAAHSQRAVIIRADEDVRYRYLVGAMDAVRHVGGAQIALAVERQVR